MTPRPLDDDSAFEAPLALAREGRHGEAIHEALVALERAPAGPPRRAMVANALGQIARLAETAGDLESAEHALGEALRTAPGYADLHYQMACVLLLRQKRAEARRSLDAALRINPDYLAARLERALLDAREGLLGEALEALRRLGHQHRVERPRAFRQGLKSLEHADWEEAAMLLRQALHLTEPGSEEVAHEFQQLMEEGKTAAATRLVRDALREHDDYADLHVLLGTAELEEGRLDEALSSFARALEIHPDYHVARVQLARALEALGDVVQAGEQISLVLQAEPDHPQALQLSKRWGRLRARRRPPGSGMRASA
ncbi:MAG: tetratricopeptide repeat protein [Candidatus Eisenbacteria bacterium]|uniref:Tetratricopeptide repeat protein n=1 Tax=Eiseniibacteriota bacterium TaxID=2212470 RepID=A0A538TL85_UNCEI|nr:MAG: tetratricopeptide repeat protein [Candidatus Eisenbacteria bacterium]